MRRVARVYVPLPKRRHAAFTEELIHGGCVRRAWSFLLVAGALLLPACSYVPFTHTVAETPVGPRTDAAITVAGLSSNPMTVTVRPGDVTEDGTITRRPSSAVNPSDPSWFRQAGDITDVTVQAPLARPVTLGFAAGPDHPQDVPVIWRQDPEVGWYPVAVGDAGATATAARTEFSPHLPGWVDLQAWVGNKADAAQKWARGRASGPPTCPGTAPDWAQLSAPTLDVMLTCIGSNPDGGTERVEVQLVNNRGLTQVIAIPDGIAHADVEGQPEAYRELVRSVENADVVYLAPGKRLSVGFTRPAEDRTIELSPRPSTMSLLVDIISALGEWESADEGRLAGLFAAQGCFGDPAGGLARGEIPDAREALVAFLQKGTLCAATEMADKLPAELMAQKIVAARTGTPLAIVASDQSFNKQVQATRGRLQMLGSIVRGLELFQKAAVLWENVAELAGREAARAYDPAVTRLALAAAESAATQVTILRPVTDGRAVEGWSVDDDAQQTLDCGYASIAMVDGNVQGCGPIAADAGACWPEAGNTTVLCLRTPWDRSLLRMNATGVAASVTPEPDPYPLALELADGTHCTVRTGGSWSSRPDDTVGFYSCDGAGFRALWGKQDGSPFDKAKPSWTVQLGGESGPLQTLKILRAYFVGGA